MWDIRSVDGVIFVSGEGELHLHLDSEKLGDAAMVARDAIALAANKCREINNEPLAKLLDSLISQVGEPS